MRGSSMPSKPILSALVALSVVLGACSKSEKIAPEARLGSYDRPADGAPRGQASRPGSPEDFRAGGNDVVYFSSDRTDLSPEAQQTLAMQARWLQRYPDHTITIEGHADERGTREYNIGLGSKRADAVRTFLVRNGVAAARLRAISYGKERPVATCNDISCWSQNRRVQTVVNNMAVSRY